MALPGLHMWNCNFKALKLCVNNYSPVLVNNKLFKFKNLLPHTKFRFLYDVKYSCIFSQETEKHQVLNRKKYRFPQAARKNHFETRSQKIIFKPVTETKGKSISHTCLMESLQNCRSVEEQIDLFLSMVKLPEDDINLRRSICKDLERALQPYFLSAVSVCLIGSSINGLGLKGCDVDLSLQFSILNANEHPTEEKFVSTEENEDVKVPVNKVYAVKTQLLTVRKILQELKFKEPLTVIPGRCPILNFSYQNLPCDLSVNNRLALHSTNLMLLCGKLDDRFSPLMRVIVYWAKQWGLVGGPGRFKTYAVFLMVVHFLQTRSPPVLPAVQAMFDRTDFLENLDNWSYDITKYLSHFESSPNCQTIDELLREFFVFYGNYDFSRIITPISGHSAERKLFSAEIDCDNSFVLNTICIQDPLNPAWNVTTGVSWKHCKNFMKAVITAWEKYQDRSCWTPQTQRWGLAALLDHQYAPSSLVNVREFTIDLPRRFPQTASADRVRHVLVHCLGFECHPNADWPQGVGNKSPEAADDNSELLARYVFAARDTWLGRNSYGCSASSSGDVFDLEHEISEKLKLQRGNSEKETFHFACECYGACVGDEEYLRVRFRVLNSDRFIPKLVLFLKEYVPRLMGERE